MAKYLDQSQVSRGLVISAFIISFFGSGFSSDDVRNDVSKTLYYLGLGFLISSMLTSFGKNCLGMGEDAAPDWFAPVPDKEPVVDDVSSGPEEPLRESVPSEAPAPEDLPELSASKNEDRARPVHVSTCVRARHWAPKD